MRSFEPVAAAAGYVYNEVAGSYADGITMQAMVTKGHRAIKHTMACSFMWCPVCKNTRTMITVVNGAVYLMLPRAA